MEEKVYILRNICENSISSYNEIVGVYKNVEDAIQMMTSCCEDICVQLDENDYEDKNFGEYKVYKDEKIPGNYDWDSNAIVIEGDCFLSDHYEAFWIEEFPVVVL